MQNKKIRVSETIVVAPDVNCSGTQQCSWIRGGISVEFYHERYRTPWVSRAESHPVPQHADHAKRWGYQVTPTLRYIPSVERRCLQWCVVTILGFLV